jgi:hypothetical protein
VLALWAGQCQLGRLSRRALWLAAPLAAVVAFGLLAQGRGHLTGMSERALLVVVTCWALAAAVVMVRSAPEGPVPRSRYDRRTPGVRAGRRPG